MEEVEKSETFENSQEENKFDKLFEDPEFKNYIEEKIVNPLKNKNNEIISEKRKLQKKLQEFSHFSNEENVDEKDEIKTNRKVQEYEKKIKEFESKYLAEKERNNKILVENNLSKSLIDAGVDPDFIDFSLTYIMSKHKIEVEDNNEIYIDDINISDFIKSFITSDKNKKLLGKSPSLGGGSRGAVNSQAGLNNKKFSEMSENEKVEYLRKHGREAVLNLLKK